MSRGTDIYLSIEGSLSMIISFPKVKQQFHTKSNGIHEVEG